MKIDTKDSDLHHGLFRERCLSLTWKQRTHSKMVSLGYGRFDISIKYKSGGI